MWQVPVYLRHECRVVDALKKRKKKKLNNQKLTHEFVPVEQVLKLEMRLARANFISVSFGYQAISAVLVHHFSNDMKIQKNVVCKRQEESEGRLSIPEDQMKGTRAIDPTPPNPYFFLVVKAQVHVTFFPCVMIRLFWQWQKGSIIGIIITRYFCCKNHPLKFGQGEYIGILKMFEKLVKNRDNVLQGT